MSLLADLLSKVAPKKIEGGIPPSLERVVFDSKRKTVTRRRLVLAGGVAAALIIGGIALVSYVDLIGRSSRPSPSSSASPVVSKGPPTAPPQGAQSQPPKGAATPSPDAKRGPAPALTSQTARTPDTSIPKVAARSKDTPAAKVASHQATNPEPAENRSESDRGGKPASVRYSAERDEFLYTARNLEATKDYDQALHYYKKALDLDRQNYVVMSNMASILIAKGSFREAADYARSSLSINKEHVPSLVNLGIASIQLGNVDEGSACLAKAVSLEPANKHALLNLALLYERQKDYDEARRIYARLSGLRDVRGHLGIARVAEKAGRTDDARRAYREVLAMDGIDEANKKLATERLAALEGR
jgi:predicted Zn-dependent protease